MRRFIAKDGKVVEEIPPTPSNAFKRQLCPQCGKLFELIYEEHEEPYTLRIFIDGEYGNLYAVEIWCPFCDYMERL